jgi:hypothetical protein
MLKVVSVTVALVFAVLAAIPTIASAGDTGPCDHCTMEPIIIKGERPKKKAPTASGQLQIAQPDQSAGKKTN